MGYGLSLARAPTDSAKGRCTPTPSPRPRRRGSRRAELGTLVPAQPAAARQQVSPADERLAAAGGRAHGGAASPLDKIVDLLP